MMEQTTKTNESRREQVHVDFKMVTFTLAGKDYGIDIMNVKEISKASKFTFVPNSAPFVKGVYNLRGEIISVIDLRSFFNLPVGPGNAEGLENMIILRLENHVIAVIVDVIDKVVGIASDTIQPPHPLFGDINIKYISGVVENLGKLYVILDVERIFGTEEIVDKAPVAGRNTVLASEQPLAAPLKRAPTTDGSVVAMAGKEDIDIGFIKETLATFLGFHSSPVNQDWIGKRFSSWKKQRGDQVQLASQADAEAFLMPFVSPFSKQFWSADYIEKVKSFLPTGHVGNFNVWNAGCGSGHESYSIACMVKAVMPKVHLRIIAHDNDLISISTAPGLVIDPAAIDPSYTRFLTDGTRGKQFNKEIKDAILFEYHDITHDNTLPRLDMVVIRDTISYLVPERQEYLFRILDELMKNGALLLLGEHEQPSNPDVWTRVENAGVVAYIRKNDIRRRRVMRVEYINPFVESAYSVMKEVLKTDIERKDLYLKKTSQPVMGVAALVGLAGDVEGRVLIDMTKESAIRIASTMNGEELTELDDLAKATIAELANMITAQAVTKLFELGFKFDLTPPSIITGDNMQVSNANVEALIVPLEMPQGLVEINVAIRERV